MPQRDGTCGSTAQMSIRYPIFSFAPGCYGSPPSLRRKARRKREGEPGEIVQNLGGRPARSRHDGARPAHGGDRRAFLFRREPPVAAASGRAGRRRRHRAFRQSPAALSSIVQHGSAERGERLGTCRTAGKGRCARRSAGAQKALQRQAAPVRRAGPRARRDDVGLSW